jgi:hypothetical protein
VNGSLRRNVLRGVALAVLGALLVSVSGGLRRYLANRGENRRLSMKVAEEEALLARKRALLGAAQKNDDLLEGEARRQLDLIGPGEIEFRFVPVKDGGPDRLETSSTPQ